MDCLEFTVCRNLIIRSVDTPRNDSGALFATGVVGQPYQRFFPIFLECGDDAVQTVVAGGFPLFLRGHQTVCFCGNIKADISINPLHEADGSVSGAVVIRKIRSGWEQPVAVSRERQLIEIGKSSAALAHGVRNPLNAIKGAVVYLKDAYGKESTLVEFAEIIEEEISKLDSFITRFLSSSLLESESVSLDLNELLQRIVAMSNFQAYAKKITCNAEFGEIPKLKVDAFQFEHAVMNVVNNSLEAMGEGGLLQLKTKMIRRNDLDYVSIEVSDTGRGMSRNVLRKISDWEGRSRPPDGRGFGLFLAREIVRSHGGHLEIVSRKDIGTTVSIYIPADL
ncbi:MAG: ATP-binding protein [Geobacteraceae bacterium]